ncbi:MAG: agmatinase [Phycisphaerae bacterium]|nr:MAG: agmatinase [Phycisphaerae bacterium]
MPFDPDAAAQPGTGIFGLPFSRKESRIVLVPVPFDATTSYRPGTADGPRAIFDASAQVDLFDRRFGRIYERGIFMEKESAKIRALSREARRHAARVIDAGGLPARGKVPAALAKAVKAVNAAGVKVSQFTYAAAASILAEGKVPGLIGGEHSTPFGFIEAVADHHEEIGILHLDAHLDLRVAFEGFTWSHASIMHNVLTRVEGVRKLVSVGIRDFGEREMQFADEQGARVRVFYDADLTERRLNGGAWSTMCSEIIAELPERVYVSFDIDALDPSLCPHTGTPVPGGLSYPQAVMLLEALKASGKTVVGFDLVEVAPGRKGEPEWDANVGARLLYLLCGLA